MAKATPIPSKKNYKVMKKALGEMQTLHTGCSKAEPKNFRPAADSLPGAAGWPKFNQLETVTTFTYQATNPVW